MADSTRGAAPSESARIADELARAHAGDPWHGPSRAATLGGVTASNASARPIPAAHSIWELVLHMTSWTSEVARRLHSGQHGEPEAGDWPPVPAPGDDAQWSAAQEALGAAHERLRAAVAAHPPDRLAALVGETRAPALGTGVSAYVMLHGVAQHDAYHSGQIALLRKAIGR